MPSVGKKELSLAQSVGELNRMAQIQDKISKTANPKPWLASAEKVYKKAQENDLMGDEESAYVFYMRFFNIVQEASMTAKYQADKKYYGSFVGKKMLSTAIERAEKLSDSLRKRYKKLEEETTKAKKRELEAKEKEKNQIDAQAKHVNSFGNTLKDIDDLLSGKKPSAETSADVYKRLHVNHSSILPPSNGMSDGKDVFMPSKPAAVLPKSPVIDPVQLYQLLSDRNLAADVLILDTRSKNEFASSRINYPCCINIPEDLLKTSVSVGSIERKLPKATWNQWIERGKKGHIVILDRNTNYEDTTADSKVQCLKDAIYLYDTSCSLKNEPLFLDGGYEAWVWHYPSLVTNPRLPQHVVPSPENTGFSLDSINYPELPTFSESESSGKTTGNREPQGQINNPNNASRGNSDHLPATSDPAPRSSGHVPPNSRTIPQLRPKPSGSPNNEDKVGVVRSPNTLPNNDLSKQPISNQSSPEGTELHHASRRPPPQVNAAPASIQQPSALINGTNKVQHPGEKHERPLVTNVNPTVNGDATKATSHKDDINWKGNPLLSVKPGSPNAPVTPSPEPEGMNLMRPDQGIRGQPGWKPTGNLSDVTTSFPSNQPQNVASHAPVSPVVPLSTTTSVGTNPRVEAPAVTPLPTNVTTPVISTAKVNHVPPNISSSSGVHQPLKNPASTTVPQPSIKPAGNGQLPFSLPPSTNAHHSPSPPAQPHVSHQLPPSVNGYLPQIPLPPNKTSPIPSSSAQIIPQPGNSTSISKVSQKFTGSRTGMTHGLPPGWERVLDRKTGRYYFQDHNTKTTHWNLPESLTQTMNQSIMGRNAPSVTEAEPKKSSLKRSLSSPNLAKIDHDEASENVSGSISSRPAVNRKTKPLTESQLANLAPSHGGVGKALTGLRNLGNSCYMNSVLQCLIATSPLAKYILNSFYLDDVNKSNPLGTGGRIAEELAVLTRVTHSGSYRCVSPVEFKRTIGRFAPEFGGVKQQDSQEFLLVLLDQFHEDTNRVIKKAYIEEKSNDGLPDAVAARLSWDNHKKRNQSLIVELLQGQFKSTLTCSVCGKQSVTFDAFMSLTLPIPTNASCHMEDCIQLFTKREKVSRDNKWFCPRCKQHREAWKTMEIWKLPPILIVHFNRFKRDFDGSWLEKRQTNVQFPLANLDLSKFVLGPKKSQRYNLYGVSNHYGSMQSGHYTAFCKNAYDRKWHKFDDNDVTSMSESSVKSSAAYILFYTSMEFHQP